MTREAEARRPRAAAYVRESTEEQGQGFSPDAQREAIRRFAEENDLDWSRSTRTSTRAGRRPTPAPTSSG